MFHQERFPSFHSQTALAEKLSDTPINDDDRAQRLVLWRDSLVSGGRVLELPLTSSKSTRDSATTDKSVKSNLRKLSYLPTRLSQLEGIEKYFSAVPGKVLIPTYYKQSAKSRNKIFYLIPRNVTLLYGPYFYLGILDYRTHRLHGLQTALKFAGANVILRPFNQINHVSIWYLQKEIFTCRITDLHHGGDGELDRLCYDAAVAFSTQSKRAMLHIRHRFPFDKKKANLLIRKCPCHDDYKPNEFMDDDDFLTDLEDEEDEYVEDDNEEEDTFQYIDPYAPKNGQTTDEGKAEDKTAIPERINRIQVVRSATSQSQTSNANSVRPESREILSEKSRENAKVAQGNLKESTPESRRDLLQSSAALLAKDMPKTQPSLSTSRT